MTDQIIASACRHWGLDIKTVVFIAARENSVYRVETVNGPAAMRIHRCGYRTTDEIYSELLWMMMLAENGISVPMPIQAIDGTYYILIDNVVVSLLSWVDGKPFSQVVVTQDMYFELGRILAQTHSLADAWQPPVCFTRPTWNLLGDEPSWGRFWENPLLTDNQGEFFITFRDRACHSLKQLDSLDFGLVHADLIPDNVLANGNQLQLIDFDDGGFGYRLFDLATITHRSRRLDKTGVLANATVDGYCLEKQVDINSLVLFEAMRACSYIGWNISRMHEVNGLDRNKIFIAEAEASVNSFYNI